MKKIGAKIAIFYSLSRQYYFISYICVFIWKKKGWLLSYDWYERFRWSFVSICFYHGTS